MTTLKLGSSGPEVRRWQHFLRGFGFFMNPVSGLFDASLDEATKKFQKANALSPDGIVGPKTWQTAIAKKYPTKSAVSTSKSWPPRPNLSPLGSIGREVLFGRFKYKPAPTKTNPEGIVVTDGWTQQNIVTIDVPSFPHISAFGGKYSRATMHRKVVPAFHALWETWFAANLHTRILQWGGAYMARYIRGSRRHLSPHSHGSAFDINVPWNGLGAVPALVGEKGSVRELVVIANAFGWFWGGHFTGRLDGQHFEIAKLYTIEELVAIADKSGIYSKAGLSNLRALLSLKV